MLKENGESSLEKNHNKSDNLISLKRLQKFLTSISAITAIAWAISFSSSFSENGYYPELKEFTWLQKELYIPLSVILSISTSATLSTYLIEVLNKEN